MSRNIIRDLGGGLILRQAVVADGERLVAFHADVHRSPGVEKPDERVGAWTRDLMEREHPTFDVGDFTVVEDTRTGAIVSSLCLLSQVWSYGGVSFGVGRPELVGTHPDYRRRGLVRAQFEVIHAWSAERGHKMQAITGIPYYYRQFGYEMGLTLGGGRAGYKPHVPGLKDGEKEPYRVRPAVEADLPFIAQVYEWGTRRYRIVCLRDEAMWRYELSGKSEENVNRLELRVIETAEGEPVGYLAHPPYLWGSMLAARAYELSPGASWLAVTPSVVRYLWAAGEAYAARERAEEFGAFAFWLGTEHPVYEVISDRLPLIRQPYAWYVRVPDLVGFVQHIAPVLERRLAESLLAGHSGKLTISFYRDGLRLVFDKGRLAGEDMWTPTIAAEPWVPTRDEDGDAAFPDLTFLQLLFGYRSLEDLRYAFADCWAANGEARALLDALFPKQPSDVWPVT
jgi:Acetyltransferase (GNAT) domain